MLQKGASRRGKRTAADGAGCVVVIALAASLLACSPSSGGAPLAVDLGEAPNQDVLALAGGDAAIDAAIERLPQIAAQVLDETGVPGMAVAVVRDGETVYAEGFGVREIGTDRAVTPETVFQVASLSKPLSATGVAAAIGESDGGLGWDTPIHELLPGFAFSDDVVTERATVGDAFSHRTGLSTGAGDDLEDIGYDREQILQRLVLQPLDSFRNSYHYSNFGLTVGAEAVAASRDQSWEELMDELVFEPIGMTSSSARHDDYLAHENRALLHALIDGEFTAMFDRNPDAQAPAGGVSSNVLDLAGWMAVLMNEGVTAGPAGKTVADPEALVAAMSPQVVTSGHADLTAHPSHYGHGFNSSPLLGGRMAYSHSGAFLLGAGTAFQVVPDLGLGIVVLTNGAPVGAAEAVVAEFFDSVQFGEPTRDWTADYGAYFTAMLAPSGDLLGETPPARPAPPAEADALLGRYQNAYFGDLVLERSGDGFVARIGPDGVTALELTPWDGDTLAYAPSSENAAHGSLSSAVFERGAGTVSVRLQSFDDQGLGTWVKSSEP